MEQNSNQNLTCKNGCGFFGNDSCEGMCSKCFKESVKRKQNTQLAASSSPASMAPLQSAAEKLASTSALDAAASTIASGSLSAPAKPAVEAAGSSHVDPAPMGEAAAAASSQADVLAETSSSEPPSPASSVAPSKKKKRCAVCRSKVGLTGFVCACDGMYCSVHRYSDKHDCTYDYKGAGQEQIRKNNPVVKGQKIQRL